MTREVAIFRLFPQCEKNQEILQESHFMTERRLTSEREGSEGAAFPLSWFLLSVGDGRSLAEERREKEAPQTLQ